MVVVEKGGEYETLKWGTWEELILGGAILRHGVHNWDVVASELQTRTRTLYSYLITPQVCEAKYKGLQQHYSGCLTLVEELRTKRVNQLRRELKISEESIGCLEAKLETLKCEKTVGNGCSAAETSFAGKEASRDGSSAGSTQEAQTKCQAAVVPQDSERKPVILEPPPLLRLEKFPSIDKLAETMKLEHGVNIKRRRGKRKRKDLVSKEGSIGENNLMCSTNLENTSRAKQEVKSNVHNNAVKSIDGDPCTSNQRTDDFPKIFDCILENEHAIVFRRRLDSQKRARYKRIIKQHMDLDTIRSRIANKCITSTVELLRDLLLLANNALVFYSRSTREYKCAFILRDLVTKVLHQHHNEVAGNAETSMRKPPAKPRSCRPFNSEFIKKMVDDGAPSSATTVKLKAGSTPWGIVGSPPSAESSALAKKTQGKRGKVGRVRRSTVGIQAETPMKVRKRVRVK